jgi:hypothetical protein
MSLFAVAVNCRRSSSNTARALASSLSTALLEVNSVSAVEATLSVSALSRLT